MDIIKGVFADVDDINFELEQLLNLNVSFSYELKYLPKGVIEILKEKVGQCRKSEPWKGKDTFFENYRLQVRLDADSINYEIFGDFTCIEDTGLEGTVSVPVSLPEQEGLFHAFILYRIAKCIFYREEAG